MKRFVFIISLLLTSIVSVFAQNKEEELVLKSNPANLYGTLLVPENYTKTVVLIIPGSGPTDRDGNSNLIQGDNNSLKYLAEDLASNGIASLRIDKRGVGKSLKAMSAEADLVFDTYVNDVIDWGYQILNDTRFNKLIIIGHSEGSLVGMIAAQELEMVGYVSLAGTALTADSIITQQMEKQPQEIKNEVARVFHQLKQGKTVEDVKPELLTLFRPSIQPYFISWIKYDPTKEIQKLTIPILILQGTTDIQISVEDAELLHKSNSKSELQIIEGMNHVLKVAPAEREKNMATYSNPELKNHTQLIKVLMGYINSLN